MTKHQLFRDKLDAEANLSVFFHEYLGVEILKKFNTSHVDFEVWPKKFLDTFRALSTIYAQFIPEADHVIRADVDTKGHLLSEVQGSLLMYFGYQCSGKGNRSQYTGVSISHDEHGFFFSTFIGGGSNEQRRLQIVQAEDPDHLVESRIIRSPEDIEKFRFEARPVIEKQRALLVEQKGTPSTTGFCPKHCRKYWHINSRLSEEDAKIILWDHLRGIKRIGLPQDSEKLWTSLNAENAYRKKLAIAYIRDGILAEEAVQLALLEN